MSAPMSSLFRVSTSLFHQPFVVAVDRLSGAGIGRSALSGIVRHHSDHVEQTGEQLQGEVEDANPQTWGGGKKKGTIGSIQFGSGGVKRSKGHAASIHLLDLWFLMKKSFRRSLKVFSFT